MQRFAIAGYMCIVILKLESCESFLKDTIVYFALEAERRKVLPLLINIQFVQIDKL